MKIALNICMKHLHDILTLYFPIFPFDPPENIRKPLGSKGLTHSLRYCPSGFKLVNPRCYLTKYISLILD